jgi:hypothetical protein
VLPSAAVTTYETGEVKLFAVDALTCTTEAIAMDAPVWVNVATKAVTFVAFGTVMAIVPVISPVLVIVEVPLCPETVKAVISLADDAVSGKTAVITPESAEWVTEVAPVTVKKFAVTPVSV